MAKGITFWPIGEIVAQAAAIGDEDTLEMARAKLRSAVGEGDAAQVVATRLGEMVGLVPAASGPDKDTFWAPRTFLEFLAWCSLLSVVLDDIQWAEPTLLDLIEHVVDWVRDAPLLLICSARPELVDAKPGWCEDKANATLLSLYPRSAEAEATQLLANLLGSAALPADVPRGSPRRPGGIRCSSKRWSACSSMTACWQTGMVPGPPPRG